MESLMYKLKDTITTTVSSLNSYIPGNPVTREYEITEFRASAGPGSYWKIFSAYKKSTKEEASVFLLDKKVFQKLSKKDREAALDRLKKGVSQLTRLRHPSILTVSHPLEESREALAFATEPVLASLANLLSPDDSISSQLPSDLKNYEFYDVEIKYGLLQISEGLAFLHNDVKLLHRNICPEVIMINKKGAWKLTGFEFSCPPHNVHDFPLSFPFLNVIESARDSHDSYIAHPNLDFLAPEYITEASSADAKLTLGSDMYALGALVYAVYNKGKPLLPTGGNMCMFTPQRVQQYQKLSPGIFECIPEDSRHHIQLLLSVDPILRPDAHQFHKLNIFEDVLVRTLQYLDSLFQWDNLQKSQFYKGLPEILPMMPVRVKLNRVFPALTKEFINPDMVPFVLPNVLLIAEEITDKDFVEIVLPGLVPVFQMKEPIQIAMILMQNMELIFSKCKSNPDSIKDHILPMMSRCLEVENQQVQEQVLTTIPTVVHLIDQPSMKNVIIPRIKRLCLSTSHLSSRVNCLLCIANLLDSLDKWLVLDDVATFLPEIPSKEPSVIMAIIGIYKLILNSNRLGLTKEMLATRIIPFLMPLSIENGLTVNQFTTIMSLIKEMVQKVENEQRVKVEQLNSIKDQQSTALIAYSTKNAQRNGNDFAPVFVADAKPVNKSPVVPSKALSLEEKERMSNQRKAGQLFANADSKLQPQKLAAASTSKPQPKDLTSSLISSNLQNLSVGTSQTGSSASAMPAVPTMYSTPVAIPPASSQFQNLHNSNAFKPQNVQLFNAPAPAYSQNSMGNQNNAVRPPLDMRAFDSLVIPELSRNPKKSQPLNMLSPMQSLGSTMVSNNSETKLNKLTKSDVEDLLS